MSTNGSDPHDDEADTDRPPQVDWRHIFEAFMQAVGPRVEALANAQVRLGEDFKRELGAIGNALWNLSDNFESLRATIGQDREEMRDRVARVEGVTGAIIQHQEKITSVTNQQTRVINKAHPEERDIAEVASVHRIVDAAVAAKLTQHDLTHAQSQLAEVEDARKRRRAFWFEIIKSVLLVFVGALVSYVLKR